MKEVMLLQTLLSVSGNVPSSFISLINRYGETLRAFSSGKVEDHNLLNHFGVALRVMENFFCSI